jgi:hypothetical protein
MRRTAIFDLRGFDIKNIAELNYLFIVQDVRLATVRIHLHESRKDYNLRSCSFARIVVFRAFLRLMIGRGGDRTSAFRCYNVPIDRLGIKFVIR